MSPKLFNILLVITPAVLYYGYIQPMYNGTPGFVWTPEKSLSVLKNENVQYVNAINQLPIIDKEAKEINAAYKAINPALLQQVKVLLPNEIDPVKLRNDVVSIASQSGIPISNLSVILDSSGQAYKVSFRTRTRYSLFKNFMKNYEKSTRLFVLTDLSIARASATDAAKNSEEDLSDKLDIMVTSRVYFKK